MDIKDYTAVNDEDLAILTQKGNMVAFEYLVVKYESKIKRYLSRILNRADVEDISQDVFLKSFVNINSFNPSFKFSAWVYRIAHNEAVNHLKKKTTLPLFDFDIFLPAQSYVRQEIEDEATKKELKNNIEACFEKLSQKYKEIILLFYFENFSYKEISQVLKIPQATVGVRLKRAKEEIKKICVKDYETK